MAITYSIHKTLFGLCVIASTDKGICNVLFGDTEQTLVADLVSRRANVALEKKQAPAHDAVVKYIAGTIPLDGITLDIHGTDFQQKVWNALRTIPVGTTTTYSAIAVMVGSPSAVRAVGTIIGKNPVGYLVPCHRVIRSDGALGGYAWGVVRKQKMLEYEASGKNK